MTVRGVFGELSPQARAALREGSDPFQAAYTGAGTFTTDPAVSAFTFRCSPATGPDDDEESAAKLALSALAAHGHPHRILDVAVTDLSTVKIRRRR
ncbi:hypothetical protein D5H75_25680 [Bailinhaonella thermotolerans]|uniref:Uncharacterized protein n=1 Tax=Bailinhaonella thermotolerans TaxID=1070861 RepID=A0A3A4AZW8_9ACTN|nr:hypothetical protein D5H75_25680 [Bailinhaonella thermotolerans]